MNVRQISENLEKERLCKFAQFSRLSRGRKIEEVSCDIRTEYERDRDRIIHSKAFRRLKHKTQVFIAPIGDHFVTRLTHTIEVAQLSRTIARALRFNEDLTEAIALGHDLGHTPFGHAGEKALDIICPTGFVHSQQSVRIVEKLEKLNLTEETLDGILNHSRNGDPFTSEGLIVRLCDKITYINHDIDDAIRANKLIPGKIPEKFKEIAGSDASERIDSLIKSILRSSFDGKILMEPAIQNAFNEVFDFMYENVYMDDESSTGFKVSFVIESLYRYFKNNLKKIPSELQKMIDEEGEDRVVCDYIAGMTDYFAVNIFKDIFIPKSFSFR
ncbi:MAG: deoxyguanosinetriphosphate triphosphohydrolase [Candidatus Improbicoccus pseudotrichonymphae]|uniref:Deoxyguanosinetriphosphate triphosphohydrolase n=1 Tax=Candidatus Improbicoccus pseudotrichonymphae TaxID=3033792 RepID=A0AA48L0P7_9FIRM|nr:MAG: deoxyguanosinetriphosphate triphosphohydrolase [Candidatus Improbicoccus pseudotrichonymphae]